MVPSTVGAASEFLDLHFPSSVTIAAVAVYETWILGGVSGISAFVSGSWVSLRTRIVRIIRSIYHDSQ